MQDLTIDINSLSFNYGKKSILNDLSLKVHTGEIFALLGENGAGKTTLFGCITKNLKVCQNVIRISGKDICDISLIELARLVSYVPQLNSIKDLECTVLEYIVEGRTPYLSTFSIPKEKDYIFAEHCAEDVGISEILNMHLRELSGGQLQMVSIARALVQETPIIIMDEPMSALDLKNQALVLKLLLRLKQQGKTILFSTHNPNHAFCLGCSIAMLHSGAIITQGFANKCLTEENLKLIYGNDIELFSTETSMQCAIRISD